MSSTNNRAGGITYISCAVPLSATTHTARKKLIVIIIYVALRICLVLYDSIKEGQVFTLQSLQSKDTIRKEREGCKKNSSEP